VTVYVDTSVVLRRILRQSGSLPGWSHIRTGVTSRLTETEGARTLDRARLEGAVTEKEVALAREAHLRTLESFEIVELTRTVLSRAAQPFPVTLGTLDAIHLASALLWRERNARSIVFATHDEGLALAARASGLRAIGA
jgi:predicted nucleic acid-binding protein